MAQILDESPFAYDELFFSRTDLKGTIQAGNNVFQRVSEFTWDELLGRPHNVIRHPEMPRAVFYVLWKFLKAGKPIGAFVKNKAKSGRHYWVYALALPVNSGYLSVRLKPGGDFFTKISAEYENLKKLEVSKNLSPEQSSEILLHRLNEIGFKDYESFMTEALIDQLNYRSKKMDKPPSTLSVDLARLMSGSLQTIEFSKKILSAFKTNKFVPLNLEVYASRLGEEGKRISVVANQYQKMAQEINAQIEKFGTMSIQVLEQVNLGRFLLGSSDLLDEIKNYLVNEPEHLDKEGFEIFDQLIADYLGESLKAVQEIVKVIKDFSLICEDLQTLGSGLELVRITGKIESANLQQSSEVTEMLNSLRGFQTILGSSLKDIVARNSLMKTQSSDLLVAIRKRT